MSKIAAMSSTCSITGNKSESSYRIYARPSTQQKDAAALSLLIVRIYKGLKQLDPFHRRFSLEDKSIQYPYAVEERVPNWMLYIITSILPLITMIIISLGLKRSMHDCHHAILGFILGYSSTLVVTQLFKITVGRPRPDFIDRCQPVNGSTDATVYGLSTSDICTQTSQSILEGGFESFFSGHASTSFAGMGYLSLYFAGKLHVFDRKGYTYKAFIVASPLVVATLISISRTMDYRHHWQDVIVGSLVGFSFAFFSYNQYFPPLHSHVCHQPFAVRLKEPEPEHTADFSFHDGSTFKVSVTRKDGEIVHKSDYATTPEELNQV
ncbi:10114_t:CDS:2 [Diversispora eburnea]|uniref:10114_t:CDS:1 n=1 Tax=Diversispora eburnea TaxID=1213867 RepID=A0A9N8YU90_9GLOM|nr:10114_t:CDS:2 [Diversispora eburnea]